jgi:hypothetical protein
MARHDDGERRLPGLCIQVAGMVFDGTFRPTAFPDDLAIRFGFAVKKHRIYKKKSRLIVAGNGGIRYADVIGALREYSAIEATSVAKSESLAELARKLAETVVRVYSLALVFEGGGGHAILFIRVTMALFVYDPAIGLLLIRDIDLMAVARFLVAYRDALIQTA